MTTPNRPAGAGLGRAGLWPEHIPRPTAAPAPPAAGAAGAAPSDQLPPEESPFRWPWHGVEWNLTYVGFLGYIFAITTYRLPIGDVSIAVALFGLVLQKEPLRLPGVVKGLTLFLVWAAIGYVTSSYRALVFDQLNVLVKLLLIAVVAANALRTRAQLRFFVVFWLGCFALYPVRGSLFNYYLYRSTLFGRAIWNYTFANPNDLGAYCILQLSMALGVNALEKKGPVRFASRLGMAVLPMVLLLTKSRGAFLGFAMFLMFVLSGHRRRGQAIALTVVLSALLLAIAPRGVLSRVFDLQKIEETGDVGAADEEGSAAQRYEIWKVAGTIIREHPIAGVGLGAYPAAHSRYALRPQFLRIAHGRRDTHSTYFNVAAETGLVGLAIFLASYASTLLAVERVRRRARAVRPRTAQILFMMQVGTIGFLTSALFGSMAHVSFLLLHVVVTWCFAELVKSELAGATRRHAGMASRVRTGALLPAGA
ncbi:MAG TPA: O-antigen ligase family protein [Gemmatimonadaceae bacterium]|nr:O-antigen ligase family protein [Gemmatimonadaceae bacterium]